MKIFSYAMSMADDQDVLSDALDSLAHFSDRIFVVDGLMGSGTLCHHPRYSDTSLFNFFCHSDAVSGMSAKAGGDTYVAQWRGIPLKVWENDFKDPAHQRNFALDKMSLEPEQPDWIVWADSDEVCSWEFINGIRQHLGALSNDVMGVYIKRLNLVQDEEHCVDSSQSNWLAHPTIHRPKSASFSGAWHEHMVIDRNLLDRWDIWGIIHTRALLRVRLWKQRGHSSITGGDTPFWDKVHMEEVPAGVTWNGLLHWPADEVEIPFDIDIRDFQGGKYAQL